MALVQRYVTFLEAYSRRVVVLLLALVALAAPFAFQLSGTTTDNFGAAPGTQSKAESDAISAVFPRPFNDIETVYVKCLKGDCTCTSADTCEGFKRILDELKQDIAKYLDDGTVVAVTSFFDFSGDLANLGFAYYNSSANSMIASLELDARHEARVKTAVSAAVKSAESLSSEEFAIYVTGKTAALVLSTKEVGKTIGMADGTGIIFIVLLFGWQVRSWRLTLIPVFNTVLCLIATEGLIYPLAKSGAITLPSYVPNVCLFLSIALSVDYSFFHLIRFQEARRDGAELADAVVEMVTTAGRVVLVSGVVLLFTWLALASFPVFGTDSLGYCASITIFVCITVNLTMNPALVLTSPRFFGRAAQDPWHCCRSRRQSAAMSSDPLTPQAGGARERKNCYGFIALHLTKAPGMYLVPLIVYAILLPGTIRLFNADLVVGGISGGTAQTKLATQSILQDFPGSSGEVPLTVMLTPPLSVDVKSQTYFENGCALAQLLHIKTGIASTAFRGIMLTSQPSEGGHVSCLGWDEASNELNSTSDGGIYGWAWKMAVNTANTSSLITLTPPFDVFSDRAKDLVHEGRDAVNTFKQSGDYSAWTVVSFHPMAVEVDAEELVAARLPWAVSLTLLIVFSVIAVRYRAALVPVKLFMTIALPIVSVLGTGVFVFQDGYLNWTGIPSLQSQGGLVWINPVACTFMLIGFALDYDIFLFSRIYADRKGGVFREDRAAIVHAVAATGPIITTAGVIMALAFSGMVAQHANPFLCQMGFTMIFGILVDTFVVRTLLVPAFLSMAGRFNWWPGVMPTIDADRPRQSEISLEADASRSHA
jgi:uncharacterized membrane protein YdfJ with MMPL/SSD domain